MDATSDSTDITAPKKGGKGDVQLLGRRKNGQMGQIRKKKKKRAEKDIPHPGEGALLFYTEGKRLAGVRKRAHECRARKKGVHKAEKPQ